jgi:copper transport protein
VAVALVLLASAIGRPSVAGAHAALVASSPAELDILTSPAAQLLLVFDEAVEPGLSSVLVTGPAGTAVRVGALTHGRFAATYLTADLSGPAPAGDYTVRWRVVSTDDGHATGGSFSYRTTTAGTARTAAPSTERARRPDRSTAVSAIYGGARWTAFLSFAALVGGAYFLVGCGPGGRTRRALRLVTAGGVVLLVSTVVVLLTYGSQARGTGLMDVADPGLLQTTLDTRTGHVLLLRAALLVGLGGAGLVVAEARRRGRLVPAPPRVLVLGTAAALAATWSLASHSDSSTHAVPMVALDVVHLVACAIWLGGLVVLGAVVLQDKESSSSRVSARRFSSTAATCVGLLVVSGSVQAWQRVGSAAALLDNEYAMLLLGKLGLVGLTLLLAGFARFRVLRLPAFSVPALRRVVCAEAALAVAVLTVTSLLVTTEPARTAHAARLATHRVTPAPSPRVRPVALAVQPLSGQAPYDGGRGLGSTGVVEVTVVTPRVGSSEVHIAVLDAAGSARPLAELDAALKPPAGPQQPLAVRQVATGHYVCDTARFTARGSWRLGVALRLPTGAGALVTVGVAVT